ncbi:MAG: glycosyltransferase [Bacteroidota bacterium]
MNLENYHVYWFAPFDLSCPSTRYRGRYPLAYLQKTYGISFDFVYPSRSIPHIIYFFRIWLEVIFFRKPHAIIVIQKVCTNRYYANLLKLMVRMNKRHTLYDLDDAEYYRNPSQTLDFFIQACETVQVGSQALYDYCVKLNPNVHLVTSPVLDHPHRKQQRAEKPILGWVGDFGNGKTVSQSFSHKRSMYQLVFPALISLPYPIKFSIIGVKREEDIPEIESYFMDYPHIELEIPDQLDWREDKWVYEKITEFDIGLAPLVPHPFNEAKSAFKAKQYLSCGVPVIASDVGENGKFVKNGQNGFLYSEPEELIELVDQIVHTEETTYTQFMKNSLETKASFSMEGYCQTLIQKLLKT